MVVKDDFDLFYCLITDLVSHFLYRKNNTAAFCCYLHVMRLTSLETWNVMVRIDYLYAKSNGNDVLFSFYEIRFLFVVVICFILTLFWVFAHLLSLVNSLKIGASWLSIVRPLLILFYGLLVFVLNFPPSCINRNMDTT